MNILAIATTLALIGMLGYALVLRDRLEKLKRRRLTTCPSCQDFKKIAVHWCGETLRLDKQIAEEYWARRRWEQAVSEMSGGDVN